MKLEERDHVLWAAIRAALKLHLSFGFFLDLVLGHLLVLRAPQPKSELVALASVGVPFGDQLHT